MIARLTASILLMSALPASAESGDEQRLDLTGITAISITGDASSIVLTTADAPFEATLGGRRSGWFANWYSAFFASDCRSAGRMRVEGGTLHVDVGAPWPDPSDCVVALKANLPRASTVTIEQAAAQVSLDGDFSAVSLDSKAADISFRGHASSLLVKGDALRSNLTFDKVDNTETIALDARALDLTLSFVAGTKVSYTVEAGAALVDSALPNTLGAKPAIDIKASFLRARIE
jgi:hypothetical protein